MSRFVFNANAIGLGGFYTRPVKQNIPSLASCVLPNVGGTAHAIQDRVYEVKAADGRVCLSIDSAETNITGSKENGDYVTEVTTKVCGLKVGKNLSIKEMYSRLVVRYSAGKYSFDATGTRFTDCSVQGKTFDVAVDTAMASAASDYETFRKDHPEIPVSDGMCCYSLARNPELKFIGFENGYIRIPDFGTIYFAEWEAGPQMQTLTMVRYKLGKLEGESASNGDDPDDGEGESGGSGANGGPLGGS